MPRILETLCDLGKKSTYACFATIERETISFSAGMLVCGAETAYACVADSHLAYQKR